MPSVECWAAAAAATSRRRRKRRGEQIYIRETIIKVNMHIQISCSISISVFAHPLVHSFAWSELPLTLDQLPTRSGRRRLALYTCELRPLEISLTRLQSHFNANNKSNNNNNNTALSLRSKGDWRASFLLHSMLLLLCQRKSCPTCCFIALTW